MFKKKNLGRTIGLIAICVLVSVAIMGLIAGLTDGFSNWGIRVVNEDNLINVDNYTATLEDKRTDGLEIDVNDDGVIAISGKNETETDVEIEITTVSLKADEYTLSANAKGVDDKTYYLKAVNKTSNEEIVVDSKDSETFDVAVEAEYTIYIVVCAGEEINTTFKPVLVEGDEAGAFYVFSNK